jgi:hypothetical protein
MGSPRLLIVGAGATVEECNRSGAKPDDPERTLPTLQNFGRAIFIPTSHVLQTIAASYLRHHGIVYDDLFLRILERAPGAPDSWTGAEMANSPLRIFLDLERDTFPEHNVERLFEHAWNQFGDNQQMWEAVAYEGVYLYLFMRFTEQFGLGEFRRMNAGLAACAKLRTGDRVINLNYDLCFDIALEQSLLPVSYSPRPEPKTIVLYKPHGSFNLYHDSAQQRYTMVKPSEVGGSYDIKTDGSRLSPSSGLVPPRLNKRYRQHWIAEDVLRTLRRFKPRVLTLWGVGLAPSDADLVAIYRRASRSSEVVEVVNPDAGAVDRARTMLKREVMHYASLDEWISKASASRR